MTNDVLRLAGAGDKSGRTRLRDALRRFGRMHRPHEAREDAVLLPAFRRLVPAPDYEARGVLFEDARRRRFGGREFEGVVEEVAAIERALGIHDLGRFTPP